AVCECPAQRRRVESRNRAAGGSVCVPPPACDAAWKRRWDRVSVANAQPRREDRASRWRRRRWRSALFPRRAKDDAGGSMLEDRGSRMFDQEEREGWLPIPAMLRFNILRHG